MKWAAVICTLLSLLGVPCLRAAGSKTEEAAIRAAIANEHTKNTDDEILWTGAFERPFVRPDKGVETPGADLSKRSNQKITADVQRVEVAASGDLAYEFSYGTVEYDSPSSPPRHVTFRTGLLRVWKKDDGDWKVAAFFMHPLDTPCMPAVVKPAQ